MRSTHSADQRLLRPDSRSLANTIGPGASAVDDPTRVDFLIFARCAIAKEDPPCPSLHNIHGQHFTMIADDRSCLGGLSSPLRDQTLRELALRIFVVQDLPLMSRIQRTMDPSHFHLA